MRLTCAIELEVNDDYSAEERLKWLIDEDRSLLDCILTSLDITLTGSDPADGFYFRDVYVKPGSVELKAEE